MIAPRFGLRSFVLSAVVFCAFAHVVNGVAMATRAMVDEAHAAAKQAALDFAGCAAHSTLTVDKRGTMRYGTTVIWSDTVSR